MVFSLKASGLRGITLDTELEVKVSVHRFSYIEVRTRYQSAFEVKSGSLVITGKKSKKFTRRKIAADPTWKVEPRNGSLNDYTDCTVKLGSHRMGLKFAHNEAVNFRGALKHAQPKPNQYYLLGRWDGDSRVHETIEVFVPQGIEVKVLNVAKLTADKVQFSVVDLAVERDQSAELALDEVTDFRGYSRGVLTGEANRVTADCILSLKSYDGPSSFVIHNYGEDQNGAFQVTMAGKSTLEAHGTFEDVAAWTEMPEVVLKLFGSITDPNAQYSAESGSRIILNNSRVIRDRKISKGQPKVGCYGFPESTSQVA